MAGRRSSKSAKAHLQPSTNRIHKKRRSQKLTMDKKVHAARKGPRLDPEDRLRSRFYEPLILLHLMDRNGELRISRCPSEDPVSDHLQLRELRRMFLDQLAYVCDHIKGGDTVTAMALETQPSGVIFWVTSNTHFSAERTAFLQGILNTLHSLAISQSDNATSIENGLFQRCIDFNRKRIKAYYSLLQRPLKQCLTFLESSGEPQDQALAEWLEGFRGLREDWPALCRFAYQQRHSQHMRGLQKHIGDSVPKMGTAESRRQNFGITRHYIGRLGSHLRAAKILTIAGQRLPDLFEGFTIRIWPSPKSPSLPPPTDQLTTLDRIVTRMLPAGSEEVKYYQEALESMDAKFNVQERLQAQFQDKDFKPRVHAELNLLECFYTKRLEFVDDDRFIGCSKPACYCCYHYICLHPGDFVRPSSHGVRYLSWRPPDLIDAAGIREKAHQRDIMNKLITQVRRDAFRQIERRRGPSLWHPDSTTGITVSLACDDFVSGELPARISAQEKGPPARNRGFTRQGKEIDFSATSDSRGGESSDSDGGVPLLHPARRSI